LISVFDTAQYKEPSNFRLPRHPVQLSGE